MKLKWNREQLGMLNKIGFNFDPSKDLSDAEYFVLDERVSEYLMMSGFDEDAPNKEGLICESIMDILSEQ